MVFLFLLQWPPRLIEINHAIDILPSQVKTQYLQIWIIVHVDTSIKRQISSQSSSVVKGRMEICLIW